MDANGLVNKDLEVYSSTTSYYLKKTTGSTVTEISRDSGKISVSDSLPKGKPRECYGVLGISRFLEASYLILISQARFIGRIKESFILQVAGIEFLPISTQGNQNFKGDQPFIESFNELVKTDSFYFSYDYDLTHTVQRIGNFTEEQKRSYMWERCEYKFWWNSYLCEDLVEASAHEVILPVISGYVQIENLNIKGLELDYGVISRRDHRRTGTRFNTRGLDTKGHSVNFVETEQVFCTWQSGKFVVCSYVQVRGSIPLLWNQKPCLAWEPSPEIEGNPSANAEAAKLHFEELQKDYSKVTLVNLVDKKKKQLRIGQAFTEVFKMVGEGKLNYVWFDFHAECRKMQWRNLSKLLEEVAEPLDSYEWCEGVVAKNEPVLQIQLNTQQAGVFRTNCMDCLDRTNVVQSVFARNVLHKQLHNLKMGNKPSGEAFPPFEEPLETCFRNFWANNADALSLFYSGTLAQKTDFTRTGKRTTKGALADANCGVKRYFINNFTDGSWQNTLDIFLGKVPVKDCRFKGKYNSVYVFGLTCVFLGLSCHLAAKNTSNNLGYTVIFLITGGLVTKLLSAYGNKFVDKPMKPN